MDPFGGATTLSIMTFSTATFSMNTLSMMGLFTTLSINDTRHNGIEWYYAEYCYAE